MRKGSEGSIQDFQANLQKGSLSLEASNRNKSKIASSSKLKINYLAALIFNSMSQQNAFLNLVKPTSEKRSPSKNQINFQTKNISFFDTKYSPPDSINNKLYKNVNELLIFDLKKVF